MRRILALTLTVLVLSCTSNKNTILLEGTAYGFDDTTPLLLQIIDENNQPKTIDTLHLTNGSFSTTLKTNDEATLNLIVIKGVKENVLLFPENENLTVSIYKDSMYSSKATGSNTNALYNEYNATIKNITNRKKENLLATRKSQKEQDGEMVRILKEEKKLLINEELSYKLQFVNNNPNSLFTIIALSEMLDNKEISSGEVSLILKKLSPKIANSNMSKILENSLKDIRSAIVGGKAPGFSAPTPTGETLSLKDALGKYTIIDFWASWCKPCRIENPNVVKEYNKYHDKGLNIISVSLDKTSQRWLKAIEDDKLDWFHVSNLMAWQEPIARQYNVRSIPATFLLDENGIIIATNLRGAGLEQKLASLFEE